MKTEGWKTYKNINIFEKLRKLQEQISEIKNNKDIYSVYNYKIEAINRTVEMRLRKQWRNGNQEL